MSAGPNEFEACGQSCSLACWAPGGSGGYKVLGVVNTFQVLLLAPLWALGV